MMGRKMVKWWTTFCLSICALQVDCSLKALHDKSVSLFWIEEGPGLIAVRFLLRD
ncbi:hypothetical protein HanPSC8_Chr03g0117551 [Helianthus annuus]|nr:hypothetical protein HanPSC8_Chr03g0117551 [Helianthus annuus]